MYTIILNSTQERHGMDPNALSVTGFPTYYVAFIILMFSHMTEGPLGHCRPQGTGAITISSPSMVGEGPINDLSLGPRSFRFASLPKVPNSMALF